MPLFLRISYHPQNEIPEYMSRRDARSRWRFLHRESRSCRYQHGQWSGRFRSQSNDVIVKSLELAETRGITYLAGAEVPCVVVNMVRGEDQALVGNPAGPE